jgi:hypothetical protein
MSDKSSDSDDKNSSQSTNDRSMVSETPESDPRGSSKETSGSDEGGDE